MEGRIMAENILVTLKRGDRIGEFVPYIEEVAKPGTKVVFLMRKPVATSMEYMGLVQEYLVVMEGGEKIIMEAKALAQKYSWKALEQKYSWKEQLRLAGRQVYTTCERLRKKGVETDIKLYEGSLRKAVRSYTRNGGVQLIMTRPRNGLRIMNFLQKTVGLFGLLKRPSIAPVLLFHPNPQV